VQPGGEKEGEALRVRATIGVEGEVETGFRVSVGRGFCGLVAKERHAVVWNDVDPEQLVLPFLRRKGVRALAGVPLLSGGQLLGVLQVGSVRPRKFEQDEVELLQLAAERVALGIERTARTDAEHRARETLELSNRRKDEFLAMFGIELRNPLSAIRSAVATASLDESRRGRALEVARRQTDQLGRLIDDLLDVARITRGRVTLRKERVRLVHIIERAVDSTRSLIESRGSRLAVSLPSEPIRVGADPARLEQVLVTFSRTRRSIPKRAGGSS
jgi:signal transduction histidine kinase